MIRLILSALHERNGLFHLSENNKNWLSHQKFKISEDNNYIWVRAPSIERLFIFPKTIVSIKLLENTLKFYEDAEDDYGLNFPSFRFQGYLELNDIGDYNITNKYEMYDVFNLGIDIFRDFDIQNFSLKNIYKIKDTGKPVIFLISDYKYYYDRWSKESAASVIEKLLIKRGRNEQ